MTRLTPLFVVLVAIGVAGCGGGRAGAPTGDASTGGRGSGGSGGMIGDAAVGTGGSDAAVGTGGSDAAGGGGGSASGASGGAGGAGSLAGTCRSGLVCAAGQTCGLDCQGNSGGGSGLAGPGLTCSCSNGAFGCRVMYEGTAGFVPPPCPTNAAGASCPSRCNLCLVSAVGDARAHTCFCSTGLQWICD